MSRKRQKPGENPPSATIGWGVLIFVAIYLCRLLVPTEASEQGLTLWLCTLTFAFAAALLGLYWHTGTRLHYPFALSDLSVGLMVLGHIVSGIAIFTGTGQQRSALNVMWEWLAIGVCWVLLRVLIVTGTAQRLLLSGLGVTVVTLSLFGIWQHYIWYPQQAEGYQKLIDLHDRIAANESLSDQERQSYRSLLENFGTEVALLDPAGRRSFLARVRDSVEPIGLFVLANTFALPLMLVLLLLVQQLLFPLEQSLPRGKLVILFLTVCVLFCLILTKSRTAWVGTGVGLLCLAYHFWRHGVPGNPIPQWILIVSGSSLFGLVLWAFFTGGLDPEVISEAPKSLRYRLEYWSATLNLLQDSPVLGAGPGNFRQHYLRYKLPGSSEEILDAHNLFLEIWSGGGLIALTGLLLLIGITVRSGTGPEEQVAANSSDGSGFPLSAFLIPQLMAFCMVLGMQLLLQGHPEQRLLLLGGMAGLMSLIPLWIPGFLFHSRNVLFAMFLAMIVHLLGASGMEMPAIVLLLLLPAHLLTVQENTRAQPTSETMQHRIIAWSAGCCVVLLLGCMITGLVPVQLAQTEVAIGQSLLLVENKPHLARRSFENARNADTLSPEPSQQLALLSFREWQGSGMRENRSFDEGVKHLDQAIRLDPLAFGRYRLLGNFWDQRFLHSNDFQHAEHAVNAYAQAVELYPNLAALQAEFALSLNRANLKATPVAQRALELDDLNLANGHYDKILSEQMRKELAELLLD